jgi:hypothetical protein
VVTIRPTVNPSVKSIGEDISDMPQATSTGKIVATGNIETAVDVQAATIAQKDLPPPG